MLKKHKITITIETTKEDPVTGYYLFCKTMESIVLPTNLLGDIDFSNIQKYIDDAEKMRLEMMEKLADDGHVIQDSRTKYPKGV